jgi:hypothetical protein
MTNTVEADIAFAEDLGAQLKFITDAYETADEKMIDAALIRVDEVRRMKSTGILDVLNAYKDEGDCSG